MAETCAICLREQWQRGCGKRPKIGQCMRNAGDTADCYAAAYLREKARADEAVGLLRGVMDMVGTRGDSYGSEETGEYDSLPWAELKDAIRVYLAEQSEEAEGHTEPA